MDVAGLKNVDLSERTGVTLQGVGGWLKTGRIDPEHFPVIAKLINRSPTWLATGLEPESIAIAEAFQLMPPDLKPTFQKTAYTFAQSAQLIPWDGTQKRRQGDT